MKSFKETTKIATIMMCISLMSSCRNDFDFQKAYLSYNERYTSYAESFTSVFGEIPADQNWDFSNENSGTRAGEGLYMPMTRTITPTPFPTEPVEISPMPSALGTRLPNAGFEDFHISTNYTLYSTGTMFVYPYWHGVTTDYYFCVDAIDPLTEEVVKTYKVDQNGMVKFMSNNYKTWDNSKAMISSEVSGSGNQVFVLNFDPGLQIVFYLESLDGTKRGESKMSTYRTQGQGWLTSLKNTATTYKNKYIKPLFTDIILLDDPYPSTDRGDKGTGEDQRDYDDLVVLISKNSETKPDIRVDEKKYAKRYMVEDLGATSTSDIDFNDIVVDFQKTEYTRVDDGILVEGYKSLTVVVRALGGTLPLDLELGDSKTTIFSKSDLQKTSTTGTKTFNTGGFDWHVDTQSLGAAITTMLNTGWQGSKSNPAKDPYVYTPSDTKCATYIAITSITEDPNTTQSLVDLWNPETNNITIVVDPTGNWTGTTDGEDPEHDNDYSGDDAYPYPSTGYEIKFPNKGEAPCIVAFKPSKWWRLERDGITPQEVKPGNQYWFTNYSGENYPPAPEPTPTPEP